MSLNPINKVLKQILSQADWQEYQRYQQLVEVWSKVVPSTWLGRTRPLYIKKKVLWVATANSVWAQQLQLQRRSILTELQQLFELTDVRFTTAGWQSESDAEASQPLPHPSALPPMPKPNLPPLATITPDAAIERWLAIYRGRASYLPLCPQCQSPTPPGELQRWSICAACMAQKPD
jgi:predicted nucleic acid-binding Zn ribbon protein